MKLDREVARSAQHLLEAERATARKHIDVHLGASDDLHGKVGAARPVDARTHGVRARLDLDTDGLAVRHLAALLAVNIETVGPDQVTVPTQRSTKDDLSPAAHQPSLDQRS